MIQDGGGRRPNLNELNQDLNENCLVFKIKPKEKIFSQNYRVLFFQFLI